MHQKNVRSFGESNFNNQVRKKLRIFSDNNLNEQDGDYQERS